MERQEALVIAKFGGSSLATSSHMLRCARIVQQRPIHLLVLSATSGTTDRLLEIADLAAKGNWNAAKDLLMQLQSKHVEIAQDLDCKSKNLEQIFVLCNEAENLAYEMYLLDKASSKMLDSLLSIGERLSTQLFQEALRQEGVACELIDIRPIMCTSDRFGKAEPLMDLIANQASKLLLPRLRQGQLLLTQGFIGSTENGETSTLGRGGSDYTAALLGQALGASHIEIWTDVPGIASADPRIIPEAHSINEISFAEAAELATFGAKVLHPSTLWPAICNNIAVYIGDSQNPQAMGTWVRREAKEYPDVRAITVRRSQILLSVHSLSMFGRPGFLAKVFSVLAEHDISVDLVTTSEVRVSLTIDEPEKLGQRVLDALRKFAHIKVEKDLALVAIVGNRLTSTPGFAQASFEAIKNNIRLICHGASPHNLCFLVKDSVSIETVRDLHREFIQRELVCA